MHRAEKIEWAKGKSRVTGARVEVILTNITTPQRWNMCTTGNGDSDIINDKNSLIEFKLYQWDLNE